MSNTKTATKTATTTTTTQTDDVKEILKQKWQASKAVSAPPSTITKVSSALPPPTSTSAAHVTRSDMMSHASGITLTGGTFTNVGGTIYREMPKNAAATVAPPMPNAPQEENDHISANAFCNLSKLTVTEGAAVEVNNFGEELLPGQKPTKAGSVHSNMFEGLKDSTIGGGSFTCGARVQYYTPSNGGGKTPGKGI